MSLEVDEDEHSIEMHLPFVVKVWSSPVSLINASLDAILLLHGADHERPQVHCSSHLGGQHQE